MLLLKNGAREWALVPGMLDTSMANESSQSPMPCACLGQYGHPCIV
jgi:hypothetical protein